MPLLGYQVRTMLLLDERIRPDGVHCRTWASCDGQIMQLCEEDDPVGELPVAVVDQVMRRYGRPLEPGVVVEGDSLACGTWRLRRLRYRAAVDVDGRDYLVWGRPGDEPLACVAATVTAALRFLVKRRATWARGAPSGI